jgi:hypothetical protein
LRDPRTINTLIVAVVTTPQIIDLKIYGLDIRMIAKSVE